MDSDVKRKREHLVSIRLERHIEKNETKLSPGNSNSELGASVPSHLANTT